jgi:hypothetical protein
MVGTSLVPMTTTSAPWIETVIGVETTPPWPSSTWAT